MPGSLAGDARRLRKGCSGSAQDEAAILCLVREGESMTTTSESWRVVCQDPGDGSGDVIVELPSELLKQLRWSVGDELSVEAGEENICLKLQQRADGASS